MARLGWGRDAQGVVGGPQGHVTDHVTSVVTISPVNDKRRTVMALYFVTHRDYTTIERHIRRNCDRQIVGEGRRGALTL